MSSGDSFKYANGQQKLTDVEKCAKTETAILRLHKHPIMTIYYALMESLYLMMHFVAYIFSHKRVILLLSVFAFTLISINFIEGAHQSIILESFKKIQWWSWWVFLGFLSSCGFGSGLHTFVLYLGPFIAKVTMAAYECGSTQFQEPPYPNEFICPSEAPVVMSRVTTWLVVHKVLLESVLWGVGTAIGELPPYFMARAATLSNNNGELVEDEDDGGDTEWHKKCRSAIRTLVKRAGFIGIMLCASIPNPLFDLAGMTCGHFLVPFSTFFGATLVGKAINKMMIQMVFVVLIFSRDKLVWFQHLIKQIPRYGPTLNGFIDEFLTKQKEKIHKSIVNDNQSWLQFIFSYIQMMVIIGFLVSLLHSLADNYQHRLHSWQTKYDCECHLLAASDSSGAPGAATSNNSDSNESSNQKCNNKYCKKLS